MGLLKAFGGAMDGVLSDKWKEYYYCDALDKDTIMKKGHKRITLKSSNFHGNERTIIAVADGQCTMIVEQGRVVELCAEPGEYVF